MAHETLKEELTGDSWDDCQDRVRAWVAANPGWRLAEVNYFRTDPSGLAANVRGADVYTARLYAERTTAYEPKGQQR